MSRNSPSTARNYRFAQSRPVQEVRPPRLRVIEGTKGYARRAAMPALLAALVILVAAVIVPLIVNTNMAQLAYDIRDARIEINEAKAQIGTLEAKLLQEKSAESLRQKALDIGMVPVGQIGVISLENSLVEGGSPAQ